MRAADKIRIVSWSYNAIVRLFKNQHRYVSARARGSTEGRKALTEAVAAAEENGIKARTRLLGPKDSPTKSITNYADKNMIDLIVTGTRGLGDFKRLLLGSVASGVIHYSHCSVLVVR
jgi:nucleotide-binding universal stress UspA family protein